MFLLSVYCIMGVKDLIASHFVGLHIYIPCKCKFQIQHTAFSIPGGQTVTVV